MCEGQRYRWEVQTAKGNGSRELVHKTELVYMCVVVGRGWGLWHLGGGKQILCGGYGVGMRYA